jgi:LysM repeat protein
MYRSGVPASITLAQGLLESRYGLSELATKGNNHFGIKCHNDWQGGKVYHDDDRKGECFRKYDSPEQSFRDHSDFLRYRDRYKFLFDLEVNDYKGWAYGLKKAGYATDPAYPAKLIKLIEDYRLYMYDVAPSDYGSFEADDVEDYTEAVSRKEKRKEEKKARKNHKAKKNDHHAPVAEKVMEIPESPTHAEEVKVIDKIKGGEFHFNLSRQMFSQNGVPFVYSSPGETYASIARAFDLFPKEILRFNDLNDRADLNKEIKPGTVVYVQTKKREAARGLDKHVIDEGDTLWGIAQRYGVRLDRIYAMNGLDEWYVPKEGDIIRLR